MTREYTGPVSSHPEIQPGMYIEVISRDSKVYPPPGSIVPVVPHDIGPVLDCSEWGSYLRTGAGLVYKISKRNPKLKGICHFLKERGL